MTVTRPVSQTPREPSMKAEAGDVHTQRSSEPDVCNGEGGILDQRCDSMRLQPTRQTKICATCRENRARYVVDENSIDRSPVAAPS